MGYLHMLIKMADTENIDTKCYALPKVCDPLPICKRLRNVKKCIRQLV